MPTSPRDSRFELEIEGERCAARIDRPAGPAREAAILLAHGSGIDMEHPWMELAAAALVARGFAVMRFRYAYMQRAHELGRVQPPDRAPKLEAVHEAALTELRRRLEPRRVLLAGKSLGARVATLIAAKGAPAHGLVLYGYPLHPPRKPEQLRVEHFPMLVQPALFLLGTRDEFSTPEELRHALTRYAGRCTVEVVEGADHGFEVPKAARQPLEVTLQRLAERVDLWERETWPE
jgi:predicted alpha/beta-hydrolase family hydrolase